MTATSRSGTPVGRYVRGRRDLILNPITRWPYCATIPSPLPPPWSIEPCWTCKRPLTLVPMLPRPKAYRLRDLIDLLGSVYGIATSTLVLILIPSGMDAMTFAKAVTILLFVIGSLLVVDGLLSARTGIDRTLNVVRHGWTARLVGVFKAIAGMAALYLVSVGVALLSVAPSASAL